MFLQNGTRTTPSAATITEWADLMAAAIKGRTIVFHGHANPEPNRLGHLLQRCTTPTTLKALGVKQFDTHGDLLKSIRTKELAHEHLPNQRIYLPALHLCDVMHLLNKTVGGKKYLPDPTYYSQFTAKLVGPENEAKGKSIIDTIWLFVICEACRLIQSGHRFKPAPPAPAASGSGTKVKAAQPVEQVDSSEDERPSKKPRLSEELVMVKGKGAGRSKNKVLPGQTR
jgi:hypothetical protein